RSRSGSPGRPPLPLSLQTTASPLPPPSHHTPRARGREREREIGGDRLERQLLQAPQRRRLPPRRQPRHLLAVGRRAAAPGQHPVPEEGAAAACCAVRGFFKLDESYTPSKISIRAGDGFHNLKEIKTVDLLKPVGWVHISLSGTDPRETFIHTFMLQIAVLANHLNVNSVWPRP
uniref:DOC domain-containing protein n=1 Tax=Aegilops tauschii subsp. strangulata TaxID=200361 RepID=A0A453E3R1_AEGTS